MSPFYSFIFGEARETLYILDIVNTFKYVEKSLWIYSHDGHEYWSWDYYHLAKISGLFAISLQNKIYEVIFLALGLIIVSFAASLYTKVVSMLSPLILYACLKVFGR